MLEIYVTDLMSLLNSRSHLDGWEVSIAFLLIERQLIGAQEVEAILHCIMSVHEAVELQSNEHIERLFGPEIIGRLPQTGSDRVRRTALSLIGALSIQSARFRQLC